MSVISSMYNEQQIKPKHSDVSWSSLFIIISHFHHMLVYLRYHQQQHCAFWTYLRVLKEFTGLNVLNVPRLPVSSCIFLTCDLTLTAAHMVQYICHHHLIPAGGGKTDSEDETVSAWLYISLFTLLIIIILIILTCTTLPFALCYFLDYRKCWSVQVKLRN